MGDVLLCKTSGKNKVNTEIVSLLKYLGIKFQKSPSKCFIRNASSGNRTRAARVAGEHSTTEPPMPYVNSGNILSPDGAI